ncbi:FAD/NAD(P)-binding protein [Pseudonocardia xinjiangensis]|uniref:FAD/NAD(P)-binding protein n=1 Tax=Pseudonocardia xinjiangensis TaxID=75289 RepID=UPI003D91679D
MVNIDLNEAGRQATVAIVGGGASGTLTALHLLRASSDPGLRIVLFEADPSHRHLGVAYGTTDSRHLLNLRAQMMSAFPDEPDHFANWARRAGRKWKPTDFLPRMVYGDYLRDLVAQFGDDRLTIVGARVEDVVAREGGFEITTTVGTALAESVVLAYGVAAPRRLASAAGPVPGAAWHLQSPWDLAGLARVPDDATVVIAGSGLTAVDAAITLLDDAPRRRVVMASRRGELPRAHVEQAMPEWSTRIPSGPLAADEVAALVYEQIAEAKRQGVDWRAVVDGLRPQSQSIWRRFDEGQRRRFLSAYVHAWHLHRNRMAPQVAARITEYRDAGRLTLHGGGLQSVEDLGTRCRVHLTNTTVDAEALVNCTGPLSDITMTTNPLLRALLDRGTIAPDSLALGLACTEHGELLDSRGDVVPGMYSVGPPTKSSNWEAMAVPEIRNEAAGLAKHLTSTVAVSRAATPVTGQ